jgi:hypothetical protein
MGLPGHWVILSARAVVEHPAECDLGSPIIVEVAVAFTAFSRLGTRNVQYFRGRSPTAHALAYLRIADRVAATVARLASGSGGSPIGRAGFAPAG